MVFVGRRLRRDSLQLFPALSHLGQVSGETRKGGGPECQASLVADQTNNVESNARLPLFRVCDAEPGKADGYGDRRRHNQDVRPPSAKVGKGAEEEKEKGLQGKGDAV